MIDYIVNYFNAYQNIFALLGAISVVMFVASIVLIPLFIKKMPDDYFINPAYHKIDISNFYKLLIFIIKNIIGLILIFAGIIMLIAPGQGLISIIIGLFLMQFSGKYKLEKKLITNDAVFKTLNWIRQKTHKPLFLR